MFTDEDFWVHKGLAHNAIRLEQSIRLLFDWTTTGTRSAYSKAQSLWTPLRFEESYNQACQNRSILVDATQNDLYGGTISNFSAHVWPYSSASIPHDHLELDIRCQLDWNESFASAEGATNRVQALPHITISSGAVPSNNRGTMDFFLTCDYIPSSSNLQTIISSSKLIFSPPQCITTCSGAAPGIYHDVNVRSPSEESVLTDGVITPNFFCFDGISRPYPNVNITMFCSIGAT